MAPGYECPEEIGGTLWAYGRFGVIFGSTRGQMAPPTVRPVPRGVARLLAVATAGGNEMLQQRHKRPWRRLDRRGPQRGSEEASIRMINMFGRTLLLCLELLRCRR